MCLHLSGAGPRRRHPAPLYESVLPSSCHEITGAAAVLLRLLLHSAPRLGSGSAVRSSPRRPARSGRSLPGDVDLPAIRLQRVRNPSAARERGRRQVVAKSTTGSPLTRLSSELPPGRVCASCQEAPRARDMRGERWRPTLSWRLVRVAGLFRMRPGKQGRRPPAARQPGGQCPRHPGSGRSHSTGHTRGRHPRFLVRVPCVQAPGRWPAKTRRVRRWEQESSRCRSPVGPFAPCLVGLVCPAAADMSLRPCALCAEPERRRLLCRLLYPHVALCNRTWSPAVGPGCAPSLSALPVEQQLGNHLVQHA